MNSKPISLVACALACACLACTARASGPGPDGFVSPDGQIYKTVSLNGKTWLAEDYRGTMTRDGSAISQGANKRGGTTAAAWYLLENTASGSGITETYMYNWPGAEAACPLGWHIPSEEEWQSLIEWLSLEGNGGAGVDPIKKIMGADSSSGLDMIRTGSWDAGRFFDQGDYASYWSSTEYPPDARDMWQFRFSPSTWEKTWLDKRCAFALRLVRD